MVPNARRSPTPEPVLDEVMDEICRLWDISDVWEALPHGLSYNHAKNAMGWGGPFLVSLLYLARLTPGRLEDVREMIEERITAGRKSKTNRHTWIVPGDLNALIEYYDCEGSSGQDLQRNKRANTAINAGSGQPRQSARIRNSQITPAEEAPGDDDDIPPSQSHLSRRRATIASTPVAKRKRAPHDDDDEDYVPPKSKKSRH
jgi:hypothetical protein